MRHPLSSISSTARRLGLCATAAGLAFAAAPILTQAAHAQATYAPNYAYEPTVDELTITGHRGPDGRLDRLSRAVDISDLDLRYDAGVREMQRRVRTTARQLCDELDEHGGPGVTPSCVDAAVRDAQRQARFAVAQARSTTYYAYAAPPAYVPYAGEYAPPASAVVPYEPPPDL